jgi:hypothetical protein
LESLAFGVQADEKPLFERAFHGCRSGCRRGGDRAVPGRPPLEPPEDDTQARLVTFPNVDATVQNVLDYKAGRRSEDVLVPRS